MDQWAFKDRDWNPSGNGRRALDERAGAGASGGTPGIPAGTYLAFRLGEGGGGSLEGFRLFILFEAGRGPESGRTIAANRLQTG